ncbi:MAG: hypothetical protein SP1CHLAM54_15640 [Chlamydiia bacterium]|nr:hypothetical protein [Chlamydiia bacterium]MCH9616454.1 hypothetical protein [Chlamydiia bacterium]MCH9629560.1 hypothetical protein [Chlamydiia bacterium]
MASSTPIRSRPPETGFFLCGYGGHKTKIALKTVATVAFAAIAALALVYALKHGSSSLQGKVAFGVAGTAAVLAAYTARSLYREYIKPHFMKNITERRNLLTEHFAAKAPNYVTYMTTHPALRNKQPSPPQRLQTPKQPTSPLLSGNNTPSPPSSRSANSPSTTASYSPPPTTRTHTPTPPRPKPPGSRLDNLTIPQKANAKRLFADIQAQREDTQPYPYSKVMGLGYEKAGTSGERDLVLILLAVNHEPRQTLSLSTHGADGTFINRKVNTYFDTYQRQKQQIDNLKTQYTADPSERLPEKPTPAQEIAYTLAHLNS